jgi:hypothetical protein
MAPQVSVRKKDPRIVICENVFVIIDDGSGRPADYVEPERLVHEQARLFPRGLGCVVIIPDGAKPPPEDTRGAIDGVLTRLSLRLRGLAWVVEGGGFQAAAVRAALIGLSLYGRRPYRTHVATSVRAAIGWLVPLLGTPSPEEVDTMVRTILDTRAAYRGRA